MCCGGGLTAICLQKIIYLGTGSGLAVLAPSDRGGSAAGGDPLRQMMDRLQREQAERGGGVPPT